MRQHIIALAISFLGITQVSRADGVRLGVPNYGGNGCPAGSASVSLTEDQSTLSILFDQYTAEAGSNGLRMDRKSCNLAIPVHVPQGYSVSIYAVDYRGFSSVPRGGSGRFNVEYFFAGMAGPRAGRVFSGPRNEDFLIQHELGVEAWVWSKCGADVILRVNSSIMATTNRSMEPVFMSIDSADVQSSLIYHVKWRRCS